MMLVMGSQRIFYYIINIYIPAKPVVCKPNPLCLRHFPVIHIYIYIPIIYIPIIYIYIYVYIYIYI